MHHLPTAEPQQSRSHFQTSITVDCFERDSLKRNSSISNELHATVLPFLILVCLLYGFILKFITKINLEMKQEKLVDNLHCRV
jgi:hypothetical protein